MDKYGNKLNTIILTKMVSTYVSYNGFFLH